MKKQIWHRIGKWVARKKVSLLILGAVILFEAKLSEWIIEYLCPITSYVKDDCWWVLVIVLAMVCIVYVASYKQLRAEREKKITRYETLLFILIGYVIFRTDDQFVFYGIGDCPLCYTDYAWILVLCIEIVLLAIRWRRKNGQMPLDVDVRPFTPDTPAGDDALNRGKHAEQLILKIQATSQSEKGAEGAFAILLNEHYGVGKTTFMHQLETIAKAYKIDVCWYKPWMYEDSDKLIVNFIRIIQEKIGGGDRTLQKMLSRYAMALSSVEKLEWLSIFQPEELSIETQYAEIKEKLQKNGQPIIVLIDDVDRLQHDELLRMLQLIRNMGDFPYLYYIIAGDKVAIQNRLEEAGTKNPDEYLKKFFNLELNFSADDRAVSDYLDQALAQIIPENDRVKVWSFIDGLKFKKAIFANMRDVKRYVNLLDYTISLIQAQGMIKELNMRDVAGICLIQHVDSEFYKLMRDHDDYIFKSNNHQLYVRDDFHEYFIDRWTKRDIAEAAKYIAEHDRQSGEKINQQQAESHKEEAINEEQKVEDVITISKPYKIEILGEILNSLFIINENDEHIGVSRPTEYFKYFALKYKSNEMTNTEFVHLMQCPMDEYDGEMEWIARSRTAVFREKIIWFLQTQKYKRLDVLKRVMKTFDADYAYKLSTYEEPRMALKRRDYYHIHYEDIIHQLFRKHRGTEEYYKKEWEELEEWLITSEDYLHRVYVLLTLRGELINDDYIFGDKSGLVKAASESSYSFINGVWSKDKYNPELCEVLELLWEDSSAIEYLIHQELQRMRNTMRFWYNIVMFKENILEWNDDFINAALGGRSSFKRTYSFWKDVIPKRWKDDMGKIDYDRDITIEAIRKSDFLQCAFKWWSKQKKG